MVEGLFDAATSLGEMSIFVELVGDLVVGEEPGLVPVSMDADDLRGQFFSRRGIVFSEYSLSGSDIGAAPQVRCLPLLRGCRLEGSLSWPCAPELRETFLTCATFKRSETRSYVSKCTTRRCGAPCPRVSFDCRPRRPQRSRPAAPEPFSYDDRRSRSAAKASSTDCLEKIPII